MKLTDDQNRQIAQRLAEGASIADIQRLLADEFQIQKTYMEVRFLLDDLDLSLAEAPAPAEPAENGAAMAAPASPNDPLDSLDDEAGGSSVKVEMDRIKRPGAAVSGSVVFSDGVKANWFVDSYGRLGLDAAQEGYQPSPEDIQDFQYELQRLMQGPAV